MTLACDVAYIYMVFALINSFVNLKFTSLEFRRFIVRLSRKLELFGPQLLALVQLQVLKVRVIDRSYI